MMNVFEGMQSQCQGSKPDQFFDIGKFLHEECMRMVDYYENRRKDAVAQVVPNRAICPQISKVTEIDQQILSTPRSIGGPTVDLQPSTKTY